MDQSQTQDLIPTIRALRELKFLVHGIITAWTKFAASQLEWFQTTEYKPLSKSLRSYQKNIERCIAKLETHKQLLDDRCVQFQGRLETVRPPPLLPY